MKKRLILIISLCLVLLVSCQSTEQSEPQSVSPDPTESVPDFNTAESDMWRVELLDAEVAESLTATLAAVQYTGDLQETESQIKPKPGYSFLLLHLTIEKIGTGKAAFSWDDARVEDGAGNTFYRMENDTFLSNLGIPRLKGTDIVLGTETGYACFEIPTGSSGLRFVSDEGNIIIEIGK